MSSDCCCGWFVRANKKVLAVRVLGARGLRNTELGLFRRFGDCSDPYATVSVGGARLRTATLQNTLEPRWQEDSWAFAVGEDEQRVAVEVFDCDLLTPDDPLGEAEIDIGGLVPGQKQRLVKSLGEGNGEVEMEMEVKLCDAQTFEEVRQRAEALQSLQAEQYGAAKSSAEQNAGTILSVAVRRARGLKNTDRGFFRRAGDLSDPYAVITAGGQQLRTATVDNCLDPVWDSQDFSFMLGAGDNSLRIQVFDSDLLTFDDLLGETKLDLASLAFSKWHDFKDDLGPGNGEVEYRVRLERQAEQRLQRVQKERQELEKEQMEQMRLAKAAAAQGAGDVLTVAVIGATGLRNTDRGFFRRRGDCSDPYVVVSAGGRKLRTPTIDNELNPVWNSQWFSFTMGDADQFLDLDVYDSDLLTFDDVLGKARVDVKALDAGKWLEQKESLGPGNGEIEFKVRLERQRQTRLQKAERERQKLEAQQAEELRAAKAKAEEGAGDILTVSVLRAAGLRNTDRGLFRRSGDCSDPYAVVSVGGRKLRTKTIDNCLDPVWNSEEYSFALAAAESSLQIQVFDADLLTSDELLGEASVDVKALAAGEWIELKRSLGEGNGEIVLKARLERQGQQRLERARKARQQLESEQEEQLKRALAKAAEGAGDVLTVAVVGASGLRNTDLGLFRRFGDCSDPYVMVSAGNQKLWTPTINNDLNPVWNSQWFSFTLGKEDRDVLLEVFDSDFLTSDELLGKTRVDVASLPSGKWLDRKESLGAGNGEIDFKLRLERQEAKRVDKADRARAEQALQLEEERRAAEAAAEKGAGRVLSVAVLSASGLRNTDRGLFRRSGDCSDPYAVVSAGGRKFWTKTINDDLNPVWNSEEFCFTLGSADQSLQLEVFDRDWLTFDDQLGKVSVDLGQLPLGEWIQRKESLGEGNGMIEFKVRMEKQAHPRLQKASGIAEKMQKQQEQQLGALRKSAEKGAGRVVSVKVLGAHGLANTESRLTQMIGDKSDPYASVTVGKSKLHTRVVWNDLSPVWRGDVFTFPSSDDAGATLRLEVWDFDLVGADDLLGSLELKVADLEAGAWLPFRKPLAEQPAGGKGELSFEVRVELQEQARVEKAARVRAELEKQQQKEREEQKREREKEEKEKK